ncbi:MAG: UDP-N-acetylmuramate dehydrogenase [bacterium]|nr:UDP-N-acetylmuramate dehydrogenase [bacterium]
MTEALLNILESKLGKGKIRADEPMSEHTSFKIGGPADYFFIANEIEEIKKAVRIAREAGLDYYILGSGSNLLVSDKGIRGMVIQVSSFKIQVSSFKMLIDAGVPLAEVVQQAADDGLAGLEFAVGIPGSFGGAVAGNAGAWQQAVGDRITRVHVLSPEGGDRWLDRDECGFDYRQSRFKKSGEIVLEAELELKAREVGEIREMMKNYLEKRSVKPKEPSAGSIFVNPKLQAAGTLIDQCGLKGYRIGDAQISPLHANFIINTGLAKCRDVLELIELCRDKVREKFGIELEQEIKFIGER